MLTDEQAISVPALFMPWYPSKTYAVGDRVRHGDLLYRCLQAHTAQADWTPSAAVSLWSRIDDPAIEWPEWVQPTGSTDAYALGAKVSHNSKHWVSTTVNNVWEPGVYGWEEQA
jgi:hypothetical protein